MAPSVGFEEPDQLRAWNQKLPAKRTADLQLAALNQAINAEIIHAEHISRFLNAVG